ncbi:DUF1932 domain-containing protein [Glycomyces tenuis]|uniref:DUF1932 domain-containing protein n=1 Tax=Glycomyces tenuis TaxID=58116 RepID=UPI000417A4C9
MRRSRPFPCRLRGSVRPLQCIGLRGSVVHARRRASEMDEAAAYLRDLGVDATIATATAEHLRGLQQP